MVTVYISTHNRLEKLKRAIRSVESQSYPNIEIIVSDDASTDGTRDFMEDYCLNHSMCKYFINNENMGACETRNSAIWAASGKFITGLDDDDEFLPNRVETFIKSWDDNLSFLCADFLEVYSNGESKPYYHNDDDKVFSFNDLLYENCASNQIFTLTSRLKEIGGFNKEARRLQDWDTWLRLSFHFGDFKRKHECLYKMNHDHLLGEHRVSKSYPLSRAFDDLLERNKNIYGDKYMERKLYAKYMNKELSFIESLKWAFIDKNLMNAVRYYYQFLRKEG